MSIAATTNSEPARSNPLILPLIAATGCAALADWLFYGWWVGISLALFYGVISAVAIAVNGVRAQRRVQFIMTSILLAGLIALVEQVDTLSVILASLATASFVLVMTTHEPSSWPRRLFEAATVPLRGPFKLISDCFGALRHMTTMTPGWLCSLVAWIVPLSIFTVFVSLFSSANPLIEQQLTHIDLHALFDIFAPWRTAFWIMVIGAIWPLMRRRIRPAKTRHAAAESDNSEASNIDHLFGEAAMSRSLILFNLLFALQSALDLTYLWG